jgi:hypothetical protein
MLDILKGEKISYCLNHEHREPFLILYLSGNWLENTAQLSNGIEGLSIDISSDSLLATILVSIIAGYRHPLIRAFYLSGTPGRSAACASQT